MIGSDHDTVWPGTEAVRALEVYGRSPALDILPDLRAWDKLSPEERIRVSAAFMRWKLGLDD